MENLAVSDKLLIDIWALHISADGGLAIGAAVVIVVILSLRRRLR
jgi:predicted NodU family carbamoyl transferase